MTRPTTTSLLVVRPHSVEGMALRFALPVCCRPLLDADLQEPVGA